jgi:8-amino-7-oxononanoate synthase
MNRYRKALDALEASGRGRFMRSISTAQEAEVMMEGRKVINFSGNNTLGLANHPAVMEAARQGLDRFGMGSGASRLISGNMEPHEDLEKSLAAFAGTEAALFFPSGYHANTGALPALFGRDHVILTDELNHASLIDGIRLCRAERVIYPHNDVRALAAALKEIPEDRPAAVVTESLFSMEGDRAPLAEITSLKRIRPFVLYVDEAHALGAVGPRGRGVAADAGCAREVDLRLGTLGKALGVAGAFIAADKTFVELCINRARTFIYTTAPPPAIACAAKAALQVAIEASDCRAALRDNTVHFRKGLEGILGFAPAGRDHIVPVPVPDDRAVMQASAALLERGIFCQGIRPPTVPEGASRLRFSLSALHGREHLDRALEALKEVLNEL